MPWHVVQNSSGCPASTPHAVVKDDTGESVGCHATVQEAEDHLAALYANVDDSSDETVSAGSRAFPRWEGTLVVEDTPTGDQRMFSTGAVTWDELPIPLRWNKEDSHGGQPTTVAVNVGRIDEIWRDGNTIKGRGVINTNDADGRRAYDLLANKFLTGVSIDADDIADADIELVWPEVGPDSGEDDEDLDIIALLFGSPEMMIFHAGRIRAATLCDIPAFTEATIALTDVPVDMSDTDESVAASMNDERTDAPALIAHAGHEYKGAPPREWFDNPQFSVPTPITVTDDGRMYGHAAQWGECHVGHPNTCVTAPREDEHPYFMTGELVCADGSRVSVGQITLGTGHAALSLDAIRAAEHYDNTGTAVADVAVGNDQYGIWVAGAVRPDVPAARVRDLRASGQLSGDWRRIGGKLRLVGLLAVNVPGFPVPKMTARVASGTQLALVAAGRTSFSHGPTIEDYEQRALRAIMSRMAQHVHKGDQ